MRRNVAVTDGNGMGRGAEKKIERLSRDGYSNEHVVGLIYTGSPLRMKPSCGKPSYADIAKRGIGPPLPPLPARYAPHTGKWDPRLVAQDVAEWCAFHDHAEQMRANEIHDAALGVIEEMTGGLPMEEDPPNKHLLASEVANLLMAAMRR